MDEQNTQTTSPTETEKFIVTFPNHGEISFGSRAKTVKKVDEASETVHFFTRDGQIHSLALADLSEAMVRRLALHGIAQKVGDEASGVDDPADISENFAEMIIRLKGGDWGADRSGGGSRESGGGVLARALVRVTGQTIEAVRATLATLTPAQKAKLRSNAKVAKAVAEIKAENASPGTGEDVLAQFAA